MDADEDAPSTRDMPGLRGHLTLCVWMRTSGLGAMAFCAGVKRKRDTEEFETKGCAACNQTVKSSCVECGQCRRHCNCAFCPSCGDMYDRNVWSCSLKKPECQDCKNCHSEHCAGDDDCRNVPQCSKCLTHGNCFVHCCGNCDDDGEEDDEKALTHWHLLKSQPLPETDAAAPEWNVDDAIPLITASIPSTPAVLYTLIAQYAVRRKLWLQLLRVDDDNEPRVRVWYHEGETVQRFINQLARHPWLPFPSTHLININDLPHDQPLKPPVLGEVLHVRTKPRDPAQVAARLRIVALINQVSVSFDLDLKSLDIAVLSVKRQIAKRLSKYGDASRMSIRHGVLLDDEKRTLRDYNVQNLDVLRVAV